jgi:hypothetical protein
MYASLLASFYLPVTKQQKNGLRYHKSKRLVGPGRPPKKTVNKKYLDSKQRHNLIKKSKTMMLKCDSEKQCVIRKDWPSQRCPNFKLCGGWVIEKKSAQELRAHGRCFGFPREVFDWYIAIGDHQADLRVLWNWNGCL